MLRKIKIEDAVGMRLAHDVTRIVPGKFKGVGFRKGHTIGKVDLPKLLDLGKKHIYVLQLIPGEVHEDEAAKRMARAVAGKGIRLRGPREGKIDFIAKKPGLLKVNARRLRKINAIRLLILSTLHNNSCVYAGEILAGTRSIPLTLLESKIKKVEEICQREGPVLEVLPFRKKNVGLLVTGSEIYEHRIKDRSSEIIKKKVEAYGSQVVKSVVVTDDVTRIAEEIKKMKSAGCEIIITTGGLSVDPDDVTLEGIRKSGAEVVFYGLPILPGSMSTYARLGKTIIIGAPACVLHDPVTALDLLLPRTLVDDLITAEEIVGMAHGGLCLKCRVCRYPVCPFGKGG